MSASLHDPKHAYWCAVPWCPQYVRNHDRRAASPSGPSPAAGLDPLGDRTRAEVSGMRLALAAIEESLTVENARHRINRVIESAERGLSRSGGEAPLRWIGSVDEEDDGLDR